MNKIQDLIKKQADTISIYDVSGYIDWEKELTKFVDKLLSEVECSQNSFVERIISNQETQIKNQEKIIANQETELSYIKSMQHCQANKVEKH